MNKEYNVDDILLEIKAKKSKQGQSGSTGQQKASVPAGFPPIKKAEIPSAPVSAEPQPVKAADPAEKFSVSSDEKQPKSDKTESEKQENQNKQSMDSFVFHSASVPNSVSKQSEVGKTETKKEPLFPELKQNLEEDDGEVGGFSFGQAKIPGKQEKIPVQEPAAPVNPVKKKETFKVTLPDEAEEGPLDYQKYFTNLKEEDEDTFRFNTAAPAADRSPMEATREVSLPDSGSSPEKPAQKAPFRLNFNFDEEDETPQEPLESVSQKPKGLFPQEMLEEEPEKGFFARRKAKKQGRNEGMEPLDSAEKSKTDRASEEDDSDLEDYSSSADKESVIRDMKLIKTGLIIRFLLMLVVFGVSLYLALSATDPLLALPSVIHPESQLRNFMIANTAVAALGALICSNTVGGGLISLLKLKADCDALPSMAVIATLAQGVCFIVKPDLLQMTLTTLSDSEYTITTAVSLFFPVAMLILLFNLIGKIMIVLRIQNNFKMVASDRSKYSINMMENKGLLKEWCANLDMEEYLVAYPVKTRFLSKFLEYSYSEDYAESMSAILAPVSILAAILISVLSYVFNQNVGIAISTFAAVMCVCTPLTSTIAANWPMLRLSNKLTPNGAMVAGYESISKFADTEGIVVKASDIFPPENVTLHAIKAFDQSKIDSVILDAASVVCSTQGMLTGVFTKIIGSDKTLLHPVENVTYEDCMGLSAWVNGKRVLIGNRELMINHGVEVPSMDYENRFVKDSKNIIYLSNSGELSAMFVISYNPNNAVMNELDKLADNGMFLIVETSDPNITAEKIHEAYDFPLEQLQIMPAKTNSQYRSMTEEHSQAPARIGFIGGAKTMIRAICDCMTVKSSIAKGVVIQMASLIIGYGIIAVFSLVGDLGMLSFTHLIIYQLFWTLLVLIIPNLKKL